MIDASWAKPTRTLSPRSATVLAVPLGLLTFVVSLVFGALLHLDLPASKATARALTARFFNQAFLGQISITELERLGLGGLTARGVTIKDPEQRPVIEAAEVQVDVSLIQLLLHVLTTRGSIDIPLDKVTLRRPAVYLLTTKQRGPDGEPLGHPSIADAFSPRSPSEDDGQAGPAVRVWFPAVRLERLYLRGRVTAERALEVQVPLAEATVLVTDRGVRVDVERFGLRASGFGGVDTIATGEVRMRLPGAIDGSVRGRIGSIPITQVFRVDGDRMLIEGSLPELEASALRSLFAEWPLEGTIGLTNKIEGTLPRLNAEVVVTAGSGQVRATGLLTTSPGLEADLDVDTKDLDLSALGRTLPQTRLNLRSAVEIWLMNERPNFEINATLAESEYQGTPLPVVDLWANYDERGLTADATLHERGLPVHLAVSGEPGKRLDFELEMRRTALHESPRLVALLAAQGEVSGNIDGRLEGKTLSAKWALAGYGIGVRSVSLGRVSTTGSTSFQLDDLQKANIELDAEAKDLTAGGVTVPELSLKARGPLLQPTVSLDASTALGAPVHLAATVHPETLGVSNLSGRVGKGDEEVRVELDHGTFADGTARLRGLEVQSGGTLKGDLAVAGSVGQAKLTAQSFDLRTLVASFGLDRTKLSGTLDLDVDAHISDRSSGHVQAKLRNGSLLGVAGLNGEISTDLEGRRVVGQATFEVDGVLESIANWDITLSGSVVDPGSYPDATGSVSLDLEDVQLSWLRAFLPESSGVTRASGTAKAHLEAERQNPGSVPNVRFVGETAGLSFDFGQGDQLRRLDAIDVSARGSINQERQRVELALGVKDGEGDLLTASGGIGLPLDEWIAAPPAANTVQDVVQAAPLECVVLIPERRLVDFPDALRLPPWEGRLAARAILRGSAQDPEFDVNLSALDIEGAELGLLRPVSLETTARYRLTTGLLSGSLQARQGSSRVASAALKVVVPLAHVTGEVPVGTAAWTGALQVVVEDAPLGLVAALTEQQVGGTAQGSIGITRKGYPIAVDASLRLKQVVVAGTALGEGDLSLAIKEHALRATAALEDEFGNLEAQATLAVNPTPWALEIDRNAEIALGITSRGHDAAVLQPFVSTTLSELGGELNGSFQLHLRPGSSSDGPMDARVSGQMTMEDGVVTPSAMGLRFTDTNFAVRAERRGEFNVLHLSDLRAKARSGSDNIRGEATVYLKGLTFDHATFRLDPKQLPLMKSGAQIASVTGTLRGEFQNFESHQAVNLDLSGLHVDLPTIATNDVIELSDNPTIEVIQRPRKEVVEQSGGSSTPLRVAVDLGPGVKVRSSLFQVTVSGRPEIEVTDVTRIDGDVRLAKGGSVTVLGKVFLIEDGLISFDTLDSTNPHLNITAAWRASSGVLARVTISGTASAPTLEWSSDPPLPGGEDEVIALVLGGGGGAAKSGGSGGAAIAGMAMAVNQLIGETGIRNVEVYAGREAEAAEGEVARLSQRSWDSYTASIQLTDELWFQGSYKAESTGPGGTTPRSGISGTLDWRFAPAWSASTEIGMLGVGLDLLWQHRY